MSDPYLREGYRDGQSSEAARNIGTNQAQQGMNSSPQGAGEHWTAFNERQAAYEREQRRLADQNK